MCTVQKENLKKIAKKYNLKIIYQQTKLLTNSCTVKRCECALCEKKIAKKMSTKATSFCQSYTSQVL